MHSESCTNYKSIAQLIVIKGTYLCLTPRSRNRELPVPQKPSFCPLSGCISPPAEGNYSDQNNFGSFFFLVLSINEAILYIPYIVYTLVYDFFVQNDVWDLSMLLCELWFIHSHCCIVFNFVNTLQLIYQFYYLWVFWVISRFSHHK